MAKARIKIKIARPEAQSEFNATSFGFLVSSLARMLERTLATALRPYGVAPAQWSTLRHLWTNEGISQRQLSVLVGVEQATLTRTIDRLVRDKLVVRHQHPEGGRQYAINLTKRGRELREALIPLVKGVNRRALRVVRPRDLQRLLNELVIVRKAVQEDMHADVDRADGGRKRHSLR